MMRPPPVSTLFPYTTLFRSGPWNVVAAYDSQLVTSSPHAAAAGRPDKGQHQDVSRGCWMGNRLCKNGVWVQTQLTQVRDRKHERADSLRGERRRRIRDR